MWSVLLATSSSTGTTSELKEIPKGFKLDTLGDIAINKFKNVTVYVSRK